MAYGVSAAAAGRVNSPAPPRNEHDDTVHRPMRVIAGTLRGARFDAPPGRGTRPITDRAKETIFNILGHRLGTLGDLSDIAVLDLFAGSGAFGIECLSRGARWCLFVERDRRALRVLRANLQKLKLDAQARTAGENAWTMRVPATEGGYDLIFVDPPYRDVADPLRVLSLLERLAPRLADGGLIVFRHGVETAFEPQDAYGLRCVDDRTIGSMRLLLMMRTGGSDHA